MKSHILYRRIAVCVSFLLIGVFQSLFATAPLTHLWTYDSGSMGAGRVILSVGTVTVGTDGSVGFVVTTHDGAFGNKEYRLYWLDSEMVDLADDGVTDNEWVDAFLQPLAIRKDHLIYLSDQQLRSMSRDSVGNITDVAVGSPLAAASEATWMVEQSRNPGVLYIVETLSDQLTFKLHAYQLDPASTIELQTPTVIGVTDTAVEGERVIHLEFPTATDAMYQLESTTDLVNVPWSADGAQNIGNGGDVAAQRSAPASGNIFYRIRKL